MSLEWVTDPDRKPALYLPVLILFKHRPNLENVIVTGYWTGKEWGPFRARRFPICAWAYITDLPDEYRE